MKKLIILCAALFLASCAATPKPDVAKPKPQISKTVKHKASHRHFTGKSMKGMHPQLVRNLHTMAHHFGKPIQIVSGCRSHKNNRGAKKSYHLYSRGCKAADVIISGVGKRTILAYWAKRFGGGRGYYCGRSFVHVDIGPNRTWTWFCEKRKRKRK